MIKIRGLCSGYPAYPVLKSVDLDVAEGNVTVIVGPNGCGKSTLLKTLVGIVSKTGGELWIRDEHRNTSDDFVSLDSLTTQQRAQKIAYLAQSKQVPEITALRMVLHGRFPYLGYPRRYRPEDLEIARRCLNRMGVGDLADRPMNTLSGGTRQKVYIAMALAQDTPVILMDEPTTFLDVSYQLEMMAHAKELSNSGRSVVMVLHDLPMALEYADHLVVMDEGKIVFAGKPEDVYSDGCLDRVFGVTVNRVETKDGWKFYCV